MEILEGHNKFYVNDAEGNQVAEIVFVPTGEHLSIIEHTDVDPSLKGQGVGKQLVAKVVEKMRGRTAKLSCCVRLRSMSLIIRGSMTIFGRKTDARHCAGQHTQPTNITDTHSTPTISVSRLPMERYGFNDGIRYVDSVGMMNRIMAISGPLMA